MANATRATIARPILFFTVLLRVQLSLCTMLSLLTVRLADTYRLVGMYYAPYVPPVKPFQGALATFLLTATHPNHNRALRSHSSIQSSPLLSRSQPNWTIYPVMHPDKPALISSRGRRTRDGLLKAAKALFLLKGLSAVTVDEICLAADISKGGFYHHFPDKKSAFLVVAVEELTREVELSMQPASDTLVESGPSALSVDLWAWAPRHPQAWRLVRAVHHRALRQLSKLPGQAAPGTASTGDREAQAALALVVGIGRVVQHATARYPTSSERERRRAAAG
jgi:AcrR family transcriptional regulator